MRARAEHLAQAPGAVGLDRRAQERSTPDLLAQLRADPRTEVLCVAEDAATVTSDADGGHLVFRDASAVPQDADWAFLGRRRDGTALLVAAVAELPLASPPAGPRSLREVGPLLGADDLETLTVAVSLGRWLRYASFCPRCGHPTRVQDAGWSRRCTGCGSEHFPRTDPAIIVAVTDPEDEHLLLGANVLWPRGRFSCLAGFVEAGERAEDAVVREVAEEAAVTVSQIRYRDSQAWPYPRSLMLGFDAVAEDPREARPDGEEIVELRWFDRAQVRAILHRGDGDLAAGEITFPGAASIAHRLITGWSERRR